MDNPIRDVKSLYLDWKAHYKKVKAMVWGIHKPNIYSPERLPEVDLVQRVLAKPKSEMQYEAQIEP